jgi:hypothetical protein
MRTIVDLPSTDIRRLDMLAKRRRVSRAQIVREAVKAYADQHGANALDECFGMWKNRDDIGDAGGYVDRLRNEWEDRLGELYRKR